MKLSEECKECHNAVGAGLLVQDGRRGWGIPVLMMTAYSAIAYCPFCGHPLPSTRVRADECAARFVPTKHDLEGLEAGSVAQSVLGREPGTVEPPVLVYTESPSGPCWLGRTPRGPRIVKRFWAESRCTSGMEVFAEVEVVGASITSLTLRRHDGTGAHLRGVIDAEWSVAKPRTSWRWS